MPEPTQICVLTDNPVVIGEVDEIPQPEGEDWELQTVQVLDPEGGPRTVYYIWVKE